MHLKFETFVKRFWQRVIKLENGCWEWTGKINNYGYGICQFNKKEKPAHCVAYAWKYGPIPNGLVADHTCRNRRCVNPDHVEPVTNIVNVLRGESPFAQKKRQTHCIHGHPLTGPNLRIRPDGHRACRACARDASTRYRRQRKETQ
jgi:hypothetical protein